MATDKMIPVNEQPGPSFSTEQAVALRGETAALAQAEQAKAAVQARYLMAMKNPRDLDTVRVRLMRECERPGFAEAGRYHKPIGKGVEGLSIRFAEAAARCMTNILVESHVIFDDADKRQIRVSVTDLESNVTYPIDVMISKTVERRKVPDGETALSVRINSKNERVYTVTATEDDLLNKQNAQVSKAIRTGVLRLVPGDIQDECEQAMLDTLKNRDAKDPDAAKKRVLDAFARLNIMPADIKTYLGHPVEQMNPVEITELRALHNAIRDGEANWAAAIEGRAAKTGEIKPQAAGDVKQSALDKLAAAPVPDAAIPGCAGCGKNKPAPLAADEDGRAFHAECLEVLRKAKR